MEVRRRTGAGLLAPCRSHSASLIDASVLARPKDIARRGDGMSLFGTKLKCSSALDYDRYQTNCRLIISSSQGHAVAHQAHSAILALATPSIINPVAIANIETV